jgi:cytoskeleton protein RodZ
MTSVGEILRTERESQGREIAEIAEELCITPCYLRAIEKDDLKSLPGVFFYRSFAKQYAALLAIDAKRLLPGIEALTATVEPLPLPGADPRFSEGAKGQAQYAGTGMLHSGTPPVRLLDPIVEDGNRRYFPDRRIGLSTAGLVAMLLGCSGFYAWWIKAPQLSAANPRRQAPSTVVATPVNTSAVTAGTTSAGQENSTPTVNVTSTTDSEGHVVLNLAATEETWLSITSDGKQIFSGILQPSQTKTLTGLEAAKMRVGNAGGLEVRWNGKPIGPIGPRGQVRVILFTPENFQILEPSQPL